MARKLKGMRLKRGKWQVFVRVHTGPGGFKSTTFDLTSTVEERREWQADQQDKYSGPTTAAGSFAADILVYLARVAAMPTINQVTAHLALWARELGRDRPRRTITTTEIDIVLNDWLDEGLSNDTVRKRRSTLRSFFARMDGKTSTRKNPVKGSVSPEPGKAEARSIDYLAIERALAYMPKHRDTKKGLPRRLSLSKIRAGVIAYSGIPPGLLQKVLPHDLVLVGTGSVRVSRRKKGGGVAARTVPLTPEALAWFKLFHAANAYGTFAIESLNRSFKRAAKKAGLDPKAVHLYDLRHSFLTEIYRVTRDLETVGRLGLHAAGSKMTARYAQAANQSVDVAATTAFSAALATQRQLSLKAAAVQESGKKLPAKVARQTAISRKASKTRHLRRVS